MKVKLIDVVALAVAINEKGMQKDWIKRGISRTFKVSDIKKWVKINEIK